MQDLEVLKHLSKLYLGPSSINIRSEAFLSSIMYHASKLTVLHLTSLSNLSETYISDIIFASPSLQDVSLIDLSCGTMTIEAIVNNIPRITKLSIHNSNIIADKDIRCLISVCIYLEELSLQYNDKITTEALARCSAMNQSLSRLNLSGCRGIQSNNMIRYLSKLPNIQHLSFDDCLSLNGSDFSELLARSSLSKQLVTLSLQRCPTISFNSIQMFLNYCLRCSRLNLTDSVRVAVPEDPSNDILRLQHANPFLQIEMTQNYLGYTIASSQQIKYDQFFSRMVLLKKYSTARLFIDLIRRYKAYQQLLLREEIYQQSLQTMHALIKLQAFIRMIKCIRNYRRKFKAMQFINYWVSRRFHINMERKLRSARYFYQKRWKYKIFKSLTLFREESWNKLQSKCLIVQERHDNRLVRRIFRCLVKKRDLPEDPIKRQIAKVYHHRKMSQLVLKHWKRVLRVVPNEGKSFTPCIWLEMTALLISYAILC